MRELVARVIPSDVSERLRRSPQDVTGWMTDGDETVAVGWAWEGVMYCLVGDKFVTDSALESRVVFGTHTLDEKSRAEPRLVDGEALTAIRDALVQTERAHVARCFAPDEWNEAEVYPALIVPDFWEPQHLPALLEAWDKLARLYERAVQREGALLLWWVEPSRVTG